MAENLLYLRNKRVEKTLYETNKAIIDLYYCVFSEKYTYPGDAVEAIKKIKHRLKDDRYKKK